MSTGSADPRCDHAFVTRPLMGKTILGHSLTVAMRVARRLRKEISTVTLDIIPSVESQQRIDELLRQRDDVDIQARLVEELRRAVGEYEARYGIPSARIHEAIDAGEIEEDRDVAHWLFQYSLLCRVEAE